MIMTLAIFLQFLVVLAAIWMGARYSGVGLGLWGAVGLLVLVVGFGVTPTSPPIDVMLIILAVIMAASVMDAAGGIDFLVRLAERIIRANPKYVTLVAPLTTWSFSFVAGTGHIVYPLLPVIYETAHQSGIRPERPMAVATIASQQAITASPVAAATAAMIGLFAEKGMVQWGLPEILMICVPATLTGVLVAAIVSMFLGKDLKDDPEYQARLTAGEIPPPKTAANRPALKPAAKLSAYLFLAGVALVVLFGFFPELRRLPGAKAPLGMPIVIEIVMMAVAAIMLMATRVNVDEVPKTATLRAGVVAVIGIFGLAWLGDSFIAAHKEVIVPAIGDWAEAAPWTFAFGLFLASVLLLQPGRDDASADAARYCAGYPAAVPDRDVPVGQRVLLHPDLWFPDCGDQLRSLGNDEDRQVRSESLVHDPRSRGDRGSGRHRPAAGPDHLLTGYSRGRCPCR
jgi:anaerobic C4-dicarboxylate transporter DcuA